MGINEILMANRPEVLRIAAIHGVRSVRVFGSVARGDANATSDVDLLVEMERGRSLLDFVGLWQDLETALGRKVDLVEPEALHWTIKERVLREARPL